MVGLHVTFSLKKSAALDIDCHLQSANRTFFANKSVFLSRSGEPRSRGGTSGGAAVQDARRTRERTYRKLLRNRRCCLVVLGIELGGRWSNEASSFIRMLAQARARSSPPSLCATTTSALVSRWSAPPTHDACSSLFIRKDHLCHGSGDLPCVFSVPTSGAAARYQGSSCQCPWCNDMVRQAALATKKGRGQLSRSLKFFLGQKQGDLHPSTPALAGCYQSIPASSRCQSSV